jgi:hypothetical protein
MLMNKKNFKWNYTISLEKISTNKEAYRLDFTYDNNTLGTSFIPYTPSNPDIALNYIDMICQRAFHIIRMPLIEMPLYINEEAEIIRSIVGYRLQIGK